MKPSTFLRRFLAMSGSVALTASCACGQSTWVQTATGTYGWNSGANWDTNPTFPNAAGAVANLNINSTGAQTINLNAATTVGVLNFGDSTTAFSAMTIASGTGGSLIFNNSGAGAQLNHTATSTRDTISAGITLNDNLTINNLSTGGKNNPLELSGLITGSSAVIISGTSTGHTYLSNTGNNYTGGFTLQSGGLIQTGSNSKVFGDGTLTINGGTIDTSFPSAGGQTLTTTNTTLLNGNVTLSNGGVGTATWNNQGTVTLGANVAVSGGNLNLSNNVGQTGGSRSLTLSTNHTLTLGGSNTYTGATTISAGTLTLNNVNAIQNSSGLNMSTGTTLNLRSNTAATFATPLTTLNTTAGSSMTINVDRVSSGTGNQLVLNGGLSSQQSHGNETTLNFSGGNGYTLSVPTLKIDRFGGGGGGGGTHLNATTTVAIGQMTSSATQGLFLRLRGTSSGNTLGAITHSGAGALSLQKQEAGTWTLTGSNNYTGATTISGGVLQITHGEALGTTAAGTTQSGASELAINGSGGAVIVRAEALSISGGGNSNAGALRNIAGNNVYGGTVTLAAQSRINSDSGTLFLTAATAVTGAGQNLVVGGAGNVTITGAITTTTGFVSKDGVGTLTLSGNNTYTGGTTVNGGRLIMTTPVNLGNGALNVGGNTFIYAPRSAGALAIGSGVLTLADGSTIGAALGGTASQSAITSSGAASLSGTGTIHIYGIGGVAPAAGTNNLITAASGLDGGTYTLGTVFNNTDFTVSNFTRSATAVSIDVASATAITTAFWKGGLTGNTTVWAASDGTANSNWSTTAGGAVQALIPGSGADVIISSTAPTTAPTSTTLGANMSIRSLTIADTTNGLGIAADPYTLTISNAAGITMDANVPTSSIAANVALGANQTWTNNSVNNLNVSGIVSGAFNFTKAGSGTIALTGPNSYSGTTNVNEGTLTLGGGNSAAAGGAITVGSNGQTGVVLNITGGTYTMGTNGVYVGSSTTAGQTGTLNQSGGVLNLTATGGLALLVGNGNSTGIYNLSAGSIVNAGAATTARGLMLGVNAGASAANPTVGTFNLSGTGNLNLTNATLMVGRSDSSQSNLTATYNQTGGTATVTTLTVGGTGAASNILSNFSVTGGTFTATAFTSLGAASGTGNVAELNVGGTAVVTLPNFPAKNANHSVTLRFDGGTLRNSATGTFITGLTNAYIQDGGAQFDTALNSTTVSQSLLHDPSLGATPDGGLTKIGTNILTLTGANTYTGTTTVNAGGLNVQSTGALGTTAAGTVVNGTTASGTANARLELANNITVTGESLTIHGTGNFIGALTSFSGSNVWAGNVTIGSSGTRLGASAGATLTVSGIIDSGVVNTGLIIRASDDTGTVVLSGANTYLGDTQHLFGKLQLGVGDNRLPVATKISIGNNANVAEFDLNGRNQEVAGLSLAAGAIATNSWVNNSSGTAATLTVNTAAASPSSFGGILKGNLALTKMGPETLSLSGTNTYTGATAVNAGTLNIASGGSTHASSAVTVSNSGSALVVNGTVNGTLVMNASTTLGGAGTINGAATISGIHAPGNSPGIQTFTNGLVYDSTATLNAEFVGDVLGLRGTDYDGVNVTGGNLSIDLLASLSLYASGTDYSAAVWDASRDFTIIDYTGAGTSTGVFQLVTTNAGSFASEGSWSIANTSNDIVLSWTPIPEPGAALLGGIGILLILRRRR